ncbi:MAG: hypothetical protein MZV64_11775 [Ignavibacteriales bacterium]|nr:hypothetical protein [Ignavibacteriales bacterium]
MAGYCATARACSCRPTSDSGERVRRLFNEAAKTMKYGGLSEEEAPRLVTINPAIQPRRRRDRRRQPRGRQAGLQGHRRLQRAPHERLRAPAT